MRFCLCVVVTGKLHCQPIPSEAVFSDVCEPIMFQIVFSLSFVYSACFCIHVCVLFTQLHPVVLLLHMKLVSQHENICAVAIKASEAPVFELVAFQFKICVFHVVRKHKTNLALS